MHHHVRQVGRERVENRRAQSGDDSLALIDVAGQDDAVDRADDDGTAELGFGQQLDALGPLDLGQAGVVAAGVCLGVEAIEGTDALLARVAALPEARRPMAGGVLVKLAKPGQDRRIDLPSIGPRTVEGAARAGLRGIVVEADAANLIERDAMIRAADAAGLFLWSAAPDALAG